MPYYFPHPLLTYITGHTSRPADFSWAPGMGEQWHIASASEDNVLMVWQPSRRIWAGEDIEVDEKELEEDAMEGVESTSASATAAATAAASVTAAAVSSAGAIVSTKGKEGSSAGRSEGEGDK